jgi:hypothetical protein
MTFDFQNTYLNAPLDDDEDIFMELPSEVNSQGGEVVVRLLKIIYRLEQAGRK